MIVCPVFIKFKKCCYKSECKWTFKLIKIKVICLLMWEVETTTPNFFMSLKPLNMLQNWKIQYSWSLTAKGIYLIHLLKCTETELVFLLRN